MEANQYSHDANYSWIRIVAAIALLLIFICSLSLNSLLLHVLRTRHIYLMKGNRFVGFLLTVEMLVQVLGLPMLILSIFANRWVFGHFGCVFYAFMMTWLGIMSITLLSVIAVERFLIVFPTHPLHITERSTIIIVVCCTCYGLLWAIVPLTGWSEYVFEPSGVSCTPSWAPEHKTFVISIFTMAFCVPFTCMVICYSTILWKVRTINRTQMVSRISDKELTKTMVLIMACFLICWLPYAIFAGLGTFGFDMTHIPIEVTYIPLTFAKTAGMLNPIIYGMKNTSLRNVIVLVCKKIFSRSSSADLALDTYNDNQELDADNFGATTNCELVGIACSNQEQANLPVILHVASTTNDETVPGCKKNIKNYSENGKTNRNRSIFSIDAVVKQGRENECMCERSLIRFTPRPAIVETHSV